MSVGIAPPWLAEASPTLGAPLVPKVERLAAPLRLAAARLEELISVAPEEFTAIWGPRVQGLGYCAPATPREAASRAAWCVIGSWLLARSVDDLPASATLQEAHGWFVADAPDIPALALPHVVPLDEPVPAQTVHALLPYLLDASAPATRRDVLRGKVEPLARASRKASGVYFTPGDVAHFMVGGIADNGITGMRWLDPAAGSGVFLRAVTSMIPGAEVFGLDVEPVAAEMASFVLAAEQTRRPTPWAVWQACRSNLATADTLMVDRSTPTADYSAQRSMNLIALQDCKNPGAADDEGCLGMAAAVSIGNIFPALGTGADIVIQNPPYAAPDRARMAQLSRRWGSVPTNTYPLFVRLGLDLLTPRGRMTAVVPSSLVCSSSHHILDARRDLQGSIGDLEILNFDRAPDGLFGDDIKTRASVLFLDKGAVVERLSVGPMVRLTSQTRAENLRRGASTRLPAAALGLPLVPKLDTPDHLPLLGAIQSASLRLDAMVRTVSSRRILDPRVNDGAIVLAPTAYNWLNVQRDAERARALGHDSASGYWVLEATHEECADAVYAVLSSRFAFWTWRTYGDGFHVGRWLLGLLPGVDEAEATEMLAKLGRELWDRVRSNAVVSVNGGRRSVAFPPSKEPDLIDEIDALLLENLGLSARSVSLRAWMRDLAIAGRRTSDDEPVESVDQR